MIYMKVRVRFIHILGILHKSLAKVGILAAVAVAFLDRSKFDMPIRVIAKNKKAYFDYEILQSLESGIVLQGSEVKSIRAGRVNLKDSFIKIIRGEAFLFNAHISFLQTTYTHFKPNERRERKLLLHKKEIDKLFGSVSKESLSIVPLNIYFNQKNKIKLCIALVRGKKLHDKRESIKKKMLEREARAHMKSYGKKL